MSGKGLKDCPVCGGQGNTEVTEPCDDYPNNAHYRWAGHTSCRNCDFYANAPGRYHLVAEASAAAKKAWNEHPVMKAVEKTYERGQRDISEMLARAAETSRMGNLTSRDIRNLATLPITTNEKGEKT